MMKNKEGYVLVKMISLIIFFVLVLSFINSIFIKILALNDNSVTTITLYDNNSLGNGNSSIMLPVSHDLLQWMSFFFQML
jgi:hypothetical protein